MSKLIAEEIVEAITLGDKEGFMSAFHSALAAKVSDALEIKKVEIASTLIAPASSEVVEEEVEQIDESKYADDPAHKIASGLASKMNAESPYKNNKGDVHKHIVHSAKEGDGVTHFVTQKRDLSGDHNTPYASVTHRDNKIHWEVGNSSMKQDPSGVHSPKEAKSQLHAAIDATHKHIRNKYDMDLSPEEARAANQARVQKSREDKMKNEEVELDESRGAKKLMDRLDFDSDSYHENNLKHIAIAPTSHLKYLLKYNMGRSGGGEHPMIPHIEAELDKRSMKKEEVEQIDEATKHPAHDEIVTRLKAKYGQGKVTVKKENGDWTAEHTDKYGESYAHLVTQDKAGKVKIHPSHFSSSYYGEEVELNEVGPPIYPVHHIPTGKRVGTFQAGKGFTPHPNSNLKPGEIPNYHAKGKTPINMGSDRKMKMEEVEEIDEAKGESRVSWRSRTPEEIAKSDKRRKVKVTSAELEARARARRAEKSE